MRSPSPRRTPATEATRMMVAALATAVLTFGIACDPEPTRDPDLGVTGPTITDGEVVATDGAGTANGSEEGSVGTRSAAVEDRRSDRSTTGRAPGFVEIDRATIEGSVADLALSMTLAGRVPELMPDDVTSMRITFVIVTRGGDRYEFFAHATRNGWAPFASGREDAEQPFIGPPQISGRTLVMNARRDYLGPPGPFKWTANVAWTRRGERGEAYAFDFVPKKGYANFP